MGHVSWGILTKMSKTGKCRSKTRKGTALLWSGFMGRIELFGQK